MTVLEASDRVGGKLLPGEIAGARVDLGAESMLARRPEAVALAREVGLADRLRPPATATASIWTRGALRPMPKGHVMGVPGTASALSGVLSDEGLARIERDADLPRTEVGDDVAVGEYVAARLGREVVDRLVEPLLGGVYAGDAYRISMRSAVPQLFQAARTHTSLTEAVREHPGAGRRRTSRPGRCSWASRAASGQLPLAVAESVRARGGEIRHRDAGDGAAPRGRPAAGASSPGTVSCTPTPWSSPPPPRSPPASCAPRPPRPPPSCAASSTPPWPWSPSPTAAPTLALPEGSGFLVPPVDGRTIKASTFASQKWGWIADENPDLLVLRTSVGRYGETAILERDDAHLVDVSRHDLREATGLAATPLETRVTRWDDGLPQYPVGHHARVARIREHVGKLPGLAVCGAAYDGVGIPACIASAYAAVDQIDGDLRAVRELTANPVQSLHGGAGE